MQSPPGQGPRHQVGQQHRPRELPHHQPGDVARPGPHDPADADLLGPPRRRQRRQAEQAQIGQHDGQRAEDGEDLGLALLRPVLGFQPVVGEAARRAARLGVQPIHQGVDGGQGRTGVAGGQADGQEAAGSADGEHQRLVRVAGGAEADIAQHARNLDRMILLISVAVAHGVRGVGIPQALGRRLGQPDIAQPPVRRRAPAGRQGYARLEVQAIGRDKVRIRRELRHEGLARRGAMGVAGHRELGHELADVGGDEATEGRALDAGQLRQLRLHGGRALGVVGQLADDVQVFRQEAQGGGAGMRHLAQHRHRGDDQGDGDGELRHHQHRAQAAGSRRRATLQHHRRAVTGKHQGGIKPAQHPHHQGRGQDQGKETTVAQQGKAERPAHQRLEGGQQHLHHRQGGQGAGDGQRHGLTREQSHQLPAPGAGQLADADLARPVDGLGRGQVGVVGDGHAQDQQGRRRQKAHGADVAARLGLVEGLDMQMDRRHRVQAQGHEALAHVIRQLAQDGAAPHEIRQPRGHRPGGGTRAQPDVDGGFPDVAPLLRGHMGPVLVPTATVGGDAGELQMGFGQRLQHAGDGQHLAARHPDGAAHGIGIPEQGAGQIRRHHQPVGPSQRRGRVAARQGIIQHPQQVGVRPQQRRGQDAIPVLKVDILLRGAGDRLHLREILRQRLRQQRRGGAQHHLVATHRQPGSHPVQPVHAREPPVHRQFPRHIQADHQEAGDARRQPEQVQQGDQRVAAKNGRQDDHSAVSPGCGMRPLP
ncbi:hypothetical protein AZA_89266 [Nitrospirillum viridazoti Y2]|nr:hypothetical protein AZA_89266 [Nitrospirillum amazonense Y2]